MADAPAEQERRAKRARAAATDATGDVEAPSVRALLLTTAGKEDETTVRFLAARAVRVATVEEDAVRVAFALRTMLAALPAAAVTVWSRTFCVAWVATPAVVAVARLLTPSTREAAKVAVAVTVRPYALGPSEAAPEVEAVRVGRAWRTSEAAVEAAAVMVARRTRCAATVAVDGPMAVRERATAAVLLAAVDAPAVSVRAVARATVAAAPCEAVRVANLPREMVAAGALVAVLVARD